VETGAGISSSEVVIEEVWPESELRSLAVRFRQQLQRQELEPELLAKVERILARHSGRAARILGEEVPSDIEFGKAAMEWMNRHDELTRRRLAAVLDKAGWAILNDVA
jgi:hypothetical protein